MTHSPSTDTNEARPDAVSDNPNDDPGMRPPMARPLEPLATAMARITDAMGAAGIHAALLWGISRQSFGARCAILERSANGVLACVLSRGLSSGDERAAAAACDEVGECANLQAGRLLITRVKPAGSEQWHTLAALPLTGARPGAMLAVMVPATRPLGAGDQDTLRILAGIAATALRAAVARSESARRAERLRALHEIGVAVSRELDLNSLYKVVHRETARVLNVDAFYIALWNPEIGIIQFPYSRDRDRRQIPEESGLDDGPCGWVIRNRRSFVAARDIQNARDVGAEGGIGEASRSALHVPMLLADRVVGVMSIQSYDEDAYNEEDLHLFQMVAGQTAVAVENARLYQAVQDLSFTDDLTGLPNRRAGMRKLEDELAQARAHDGNLGLLMLDLDHFKRVNDTCGHSAGDSVLREVAAILRDAVRGSDTVARWGGEEFLILLPNTDRAGAAAVAEHLRSSMAGWRFLDGRVPLPQTITVGGLALRGASQAPTNRLLDAADACLYRAKDAGRNRVIIEDWNPGAAG